LFQGDELWVMRQDAQFECRHRLLDEITNPHLQTSPGKKRGLFWSDVIVEGLEQSQTNRIENMYSQRFWRDLEPFPPAAGKIEVLLELLVRSEFIIRVTFDDPHLNPVLANMYWRSSSSYVCIEFKSKFSPPALCVKLLKLNNA
jgi:hypothetical protein